MSYGQYFAVGKARVFETLLMEPEDLSRAAAARGYGASSNIIMSRPFGRMLDEKAEDFGTEKIICELSGEFSRISGSGGFFVTDARSFPAFLATSGVTRILSALYEHKNPFDFYKFAYGERLRRRGDISGENVLRYVWLCLFWQARLVRMILTLKKMNVPGDYEGV